MSKQIKLTQGKVAIVDDEDYEWLNQWNWCAATDGYNYYAVRSTSRKLGKQKIIRMHREILGLKQGDGKMTDHKNHCGLDNRKSNLRVCTNIENQQNRKPEKGGTSKYKGVFWTKGKIHKGKRYKGAWEVRIEHNGKTIYLGSSDNEIEAAKMYDSKAKELFGEFAHINF